jgi:N-acetylglucosamine malate deacetylase 1
MAKNFFNNVIRNISFKSQLLKAARIFHYEKVEIEYFSLKNEKCLLLAPHPDDETFACAGLLIQYPDNFDVVCLTDGRHYDADLSYDEKIEIRKKEFMSVMGAYGIKSFKFLDIEDRKLVYNWEKFSTLDISGYDYIFLPSYFDQNKDHKAVTTLLQKLMRTKKYRSPLKVAFYELWSALPVVNCVVDVSRLIAEKKELIAQYSSQNKHDNFMNGIVGLNAYRGMLSSVQYAEGYCLMDVGTFLKL